MKLELKHIAPYLPYDIEFILSEQGIFNLDSEFGTPYEATQPMKIIDMIIGKNTEVELHSEKTNWGVGFVGLEEIKPILRPLSDLTKEIEVNGEKFVPALCIWSVSAEEEEEFDLYGKIPECWENCMRVDFTKDLIYRDMIFLFKYHFDVFGLIQNNLAIDINTIKEQS